MAKLDFSLFNIQWLTKYTSDVPSQISISIDRWTDGLDFWGLHYQIFGYHYLFSCLQLIRFRLLVQNLYARATDEVVRATHLSEFYIVHKHLDYF